MSLGITGVIATTLLALVSGCLTSRLDDPSLAVEMSVTGLRQDERLELRDRVCALESVSECLLLQGEPSSTSTAKKKRKKDAAPPPPSPEARIAFSYRGSLGVLRHRISQLPHPGLEAARADVRLTYRGFDNKAPFIELLEPGDKVVIAQKQVWVRTRVPDVDTAAVTIGEEDATRSEDEFSATVTDLHEGENSIVTRATDHAGNTREMSLRVEVDTTPPQMEVEVLILAYDRATVRGKVAGDVERLTIDGREVDRDLFGTFDKELAVDPDKSTTDIVAVDAYGNARKIRRSVKVASPMSDATQK